MGRRLRGRPITPGWLTCRVSPEPPASLRGAPAPCLGPRFTHALTRAHAAPCLGVWACGALTLAPNFGARSPPPSPPTAPALPPVLPPSPPCSPRPPTPVTGFPGWSRAARLVAAGVVSTARWALGDTALAPAHHGRPARAGATCGGRPQVSSGEQVVGGAAQAVAPRRAPGLAPARAGARGWPPGDGPAAHAEHGQGLRRGQCR